jgi:hypothetical protein
LFALAIIFLLSFTSGGRTLVGMAANPLTVTVTGTTATKVGILANFTATASGGTLPYAFNWTATGGQPTSGVASTLNVTYGVRGTYTVLVTVTDATRATNTVSLTITITAQPATVKVTGPSGITVGSPATFNGVTTGGTLPYGFSWTATGGNPSSGTGNSFSTTYSSAGSFTVNVVATDVDGVTASSSATIQVYPKGVLGIDCGYGSSAEGVTFPSSITTSAPYTTSDFDGTLDKSCQGTYLADTDGALHPLVSDNPTAIVASDAGGGITIDVVAALNPVTSMNSFDLSLKYDTRELNAVLIDQSGLAFGGFNLPPGAILLTLAKTIDTNAGIIRLAQVLTNAPSQSGDVELFRVRFDIVGSGNSSINIINDILGNPAAIPYTKQPLSGLDSQTIYNTLNTAALGFTDNFTFTPNPEVPGQPLTFSAANAFCPGCTGPFKYNWDFSSTDSPTYVSKVSATGQSVTVTAPPPVINRVTLNITDALNHHAYLTRQLPLAVAVHSMTTLPVGVAGGSWTAEWLGGLVTATAGYSGHWTFCPGSLTNKAVCSVPTTSPFTQISSVNQTVTYAGVKYNFGGFYNGTFHIQDASNTEPQLNHVLNIVIAGSANVTGTPRAFTVTLTQPATNLIVYQGVTFNATITYDPSYPARSQSLGFRSLNFIYTFDLGNGSSITTPRNGLNYQLPWNYTVPGTYNVRVQAVEADQTLPIAIEGTAFLRLTIISLLCQVLGACGISFSPGSITVGQAGAFTAAASGGLQPYSYSWKFGDGASSTGATVNHTYQTSGDFNVTLTITDSSGQSRTVSKILSVAPVAGGGSSILSVLSSPLVLGVIAAVIVAAVGAFVYTRRRRTKHAPNPLVSPGQS